jgi:hypothetical protein
MQLQYVKTRFMRAPRRVTQACTRSFTSPRSSAFGTGHRSPWASALGATGVQASQSSISGVGGKGPSPSHGRLARALRPEWPS